MTRSRTIRFTGSLGGELAARLDMPDATPRAYALFAHCFACGEDVVAAGRMARALTEHGIAVLRFDFTGLGDSEGDFGHTDFSSTVDDVVSAAEHLGAHFGPPEILIGHSLGGAAILAAAHRIPDVRAVATIGAPASPDHVLRLLEPGHTGTEHSAGMSIRLAERTFRIRRQFLDDIATQPQAERIASLDAALLVMHSPTDEIVGVHNARQIFDTASHPKSFVALDGADHLLTRHADAEYAADVLAVWARRHLPAATREQQTDPGEGAVVVSESGAGPYGQHVTVGRHLLNADEPAPTGADTGPAPYDLLLAGLGACTAMTVRMYANRKRWALQKVTVALRHSRIHAEDCEHCETRVGKVDRIELDVQLDGDLDEKQRQRLLDIAGKCPVHRTLRSEITIDTTTSGIPQTAEPASGTSR